MGSHGAGGGPAARGPSHARPVLLASRPTHNSLSLGGLLYPRWIGGGSYGASSRGTRGVGSGGWGEAKTIFGRQASVHEVYTLTSRQCKPSVHLLLSGHVAMRCRRRIVPRHQVRGFDAECLRRTVRWQCSGPDPSIDGVFPHACDLCGLADRQISLSNHRLRSYSQSILSPKPRMNQF